MLRLFLHRLIYMGLTLAAVSAVAFVLIQLPPGDYADSYANKRQQAGAPITQEELAEMRHRLGIDRPWYQQYGTWIAAIVLEGDMGYSWEWRRPVAEVIGERLPLTLLLAFSTLIFMYVVALPIGIYSAVRQYSITDHFFASVGYIGLATPNFLLALILMYLGQKWFGQSVGGLFSPEFQDAPWSWARAVDLMEHLWVPVIVLGTAGTAYLIRTMRAAVLTSWTRCTSCRRGRAGSRPCASCSSIPCAWLSTPSSPLWAGVSPMSSRAPPSWASSCRCRTPARCFCTRY